MRIEISDTPDLSPKICVFGVGGAGGNAVNNMLINGIPGVEFFVLNTDAQALFKSPCENKLQIGATLTRGLGAGSNPKVGREAAEESRNEIKALLEGCNMLFITAGMGGGTGTGASPVIAEIAKAMDILTIAVVAKPFSFEGLQIMKTAEAGLIELEKHVNTLIIIPNQNLFRVSNEKTTLTEAFKMVDNVLLCGVKSITDLIVTPGLINLDFADIYAIMQKKGRAMMGVGIADGENRAKDAAMAAISNPLLDIPSIKGAKGILVNITGGMDMTLFEVDEAATRVKEEVSKEADIIFGSAFDPSFEGKISVSVVATGIGGLEEKDEESDEESDDSIVSAASTHKNEIRRALKNDTPHISERFLNIEEKFKTSIVLPEPIVPTDEEVGDTLIEDKVEKLDQQKIKKKNKPMGELFDIPAFFRKKNLF
ncbi:Cell division protein FtsZ [Candidatus Cyrtobacter comes]|uniref:Cell division protein FtsZ n=1 Tax=Candidatus Cyrtobacter comes TaxID=675776 RepID=A0ABU5L7M3_9RICK|nr:Cell division protein FtsZ [Candidatus Cyrtobacter comes]